MCPTGHAGPETPPSKCESVIGKFQLRSMFIGRNQRWVNRTVHYELRAASLWWVLHRVSEKTYIRSHNSHAVKHCKNCLVGHCANAGHSSDRSLHTNGSLKHKVANNDVWVLFPCDLGTRRQGIPCSARVSLFFTFQTTCTDLAWKT